MCRPSALASLVTPECFEVPAQHGWIRRFVEAVPGSGRIRRAAGLQQPPNGGVVVPLGTLRGVRMRCRRRRSAACRS